MRQLVTEVAQFRADVAQHFVQAGSPLLVRGGASAWPALAEWVLDRFAQHVEGVDLRLSTSADVTEGGGSTGGKDVAAYFDEWRARGAAGQGRREPPLWHFDPEFFDRAPRLRRHYDFSAVERLDGAGAGAGAGAAPSFDVLSLSFGGGDGLGFHCHGATWFGLAAGRKRWRVVPAAEFRVTSRAARQPWASAPQGPPSPAAAPFPGLECEMGAGDLLYLPSGCGL